jgi:methyl-accepting chemotaxis protein
VVHERIGLVPKWYIGSYASFMRLIFPLIAKKYWYRPAKLINTILALSKIMNFDQQLVIDTYIGSIVGKLEEGVSVLTTSSNEIQTLTTQVASGSAQTGSSISEVTATIEEVSQTTRTSVERARQVSESAEKASESAQTGSRAVQESIERLQQIQLQMGSIAESVVRLSEQGQAIGEIITTVNELAEQSNLLAVNAAIEAARAGEQGKGFTVVAQEVKNLAEQSKQATTQVRAILSDIQKATTEAVLVTEQGSKSVEAGVKQSQETGELIRTLTDSISQAAQATLQIAASSQQQLAGVNQVATAMQNIKQATEQNIAGTRQAETTANSLKDLGTRLRQLGARYQV